jgi:hypothetical protein
MVGAEPFQMSCFSLVLSGYDVILDTVWLPALGPILWDFTRLTMTCFLGDRRITWQGEPGRTPVSCHQLQAEELLDQL